MKEVICIDNKDTNLIFGKLYKIVEHSFAIVYVYNQNGFSGFYAKSKFMSLTIKEIRNHKIKELYERS